MRYYFILLLTISFLPSCELEEIPTYSGVSHVQIVEEDRSAQRNPKFNFVYSGKEITQDTIFIKMFISGDAKNYDREVRLEQQPIFKFVYRRDEYGNLIDSVLVKEENQAVPGVDYIPFDDADIRKKMFVPANSYTASIPIVLKRTPELSEKQITKKLFFAIIDSEHFKSGDRVLRGATVHISDMLTGPARWEAWSLYLCKDWDGTYSYSQTVHQLYIDVTGEKWDDEFFAAIDAMPKPLNEVQMRIYRDMVKKELDRINAENGYPMLHDPNNPKSIIVIN